ncbi:hypothetical protein GXY_08959 [Novacetimonas hansenii ATCC 23769]|uniref:Uncharacterized protein n=1 Tax=Novacetimonas hansenii ATCC 23769 TaxID=714995 RepID=D5QF74_NOVHA|nr:hypothetical protein GXY_08959 [Novacetimonas hansenii ATCC 23769]
MTSPIGLYPMGDVNMIRQVFFAEDENKKLLLFFLTGYFQNIPEHQYIWQKVVFK